MWPVVLWSFLAASTPVNLAHWLVSTSDSSRTPLDPSTPVRFTIVLRSGDAGGLADFLKRVQDTGAPEYRRFLTPVEFGTRFGSREADYAAVVSWLQSGGFHVRTFDGRLAVTASGTHSQVTALLGVVLRPGTTRLGGPKVSVTGTASAPADIADQILLIEGLDTETPWRPALELDGTPTTGPQDLRQFYDVAALLSSGVAGQGAHLVTLLSTGIGDAAAPAAVDYFYSELSDSSARYVPEILPNPGDIAPVVGGWYEESTLDVEMLSVGPALATTITLVVPPESELFSAGISEIVNNLPDTTVVNMSIAGCETDTEQYYPDLANGLSGLELLLQQGLAEGMTWFAAAGDAGSDPCGSGTAAVDFPACLPEVVAVGGTQFTPTFDSQNAIEGYQTESVWNASGAGGGGGASMLFTKPSWQVGLTPDDGARDVPDLAALAGPPYTAFVPLPATPSATGGTSASSPMTAGFFALVAQQSGCRLGDIHQQLYAFGAAQLDGGAAVFHDITLGNNQIDSTPGYAAGPGYDQATGWGSPDVAALAAAWPPCPGADAGVGAAYDPCQALGCAAGTCSTIPEGPATCARGCGSQNSCPQGQFCTTLIDGSQGCVAGCSSDADCSGGEHCFACGGICQASTPDATVGQPCATPADCGPGQWCISEASGAPWGMCVADCYLCGTECPGESTCSASFQLCMPSCTGAPGDCRPGYGCFQFDSQSGRTCFPGCSTDTDCTWAPGSTCTSCPTCPGYTGYTSVCTYPDGGEAVVPEPDAGPEAVDSGVEPEDAGRADAGEGTGMAESDGSNHTGAARSPQSFGCGCTSVPAGEGLLFAIGFALARSRGSRRGCLARS